MTGIEQTAIVGIGNLLLKDEGVGIHVVNALQKMALPHNIKLIDGGTSPELMPYITDASRLIVIDAMETGDEPGSVYRLHLDELNIETARMTSTHEINLIAELKLMRLIGQALPETIIIGVQPGDMSLSTELSPQLEAKIPDIVRLVLREIGADQPEESLAATTCLEQAS